MSYEAKHNFAKHLAHVICNFKSIAYSVSKRHQTAHALNWMTLSPLKGCAEIGSGEMVAVADLQDCALLTLAYSESYLKVRIIGTHYTGSITKSLLSSVCLQWSV